MPVKAATGLAKKQRLVPIFPDWLRRFDHKRPSVLFHQSTDVAAHRTDALAVSMGDLKSIGRLKISWVWRSRGESELARFRRSQVALAA